MQRLSSQTFHSIREQLLLTARPLERAIFCYEFEDGKEETVLEALQTYQNDDGGFGNGLEPDFQLPDSSPMATSVAMQHLIRYADHPLAQNMIKRAISYLESTFDEERRGWFAVPPQVNEYPHAFWWTVRDNGQSWIDDNWGNPSAELIGYLHLFEHEVQNLHVPKLIDQALTHFLQLESFDAHETYCYLRLLAMVPNQRTDKVEKQLTKAVQSVVKLDRENWEKYVPFPLKFIATPEGNHFGLPAFKVEDNLDFFVEKLEEQSCISPTWAWTDYLATWEKAKKEWTGILTLGTLLSLRTFNRLDTEQ
ncbi:prenyltransferase/squalene oxidase repeat-containing protein [Pontibacillus litoralis]|uniref:Prenyltransferase n=1 Tax=Pontibacillus litoralis JSM 072002 TaxID=1385512 RepID=A0A0A5HU57_9BACI|nr:hypothetical protein [Pontibacillus litoralis]KGX87182.1 hypothetical protein N784_16175 [Pontibacillus litoralis JSM 072002]